MENLPKHAWILCVRHNLLLAELCALRARCLLFQMFSIIASTPSGSFKADRLYLFIFIFHFSFFIFHFPFSGAVPGTGEYPRYAPGNQTVFSYSAGGRRRLPPGCLLTDCTLGCKLSGQLSPPRHLGLSKSVTFTPTLVGGWAPRCLRLFLA